MNSNKKTEMALAIVNTAKTNLNCTKFRKMVQKDYCVETLIHQFKEAFVFTSKEYKQNMLLYRKGQLGWEELQAMSAKLFFYQLSTCQNPEVNSFFDIRK